MAEARSDQWFSVQWFSASADDFVDASVLTSQTVTIEAWQKSKEVILVAGGDGILEGVEELQVRIEDGSLYDRITDTIPDMPFDAKLNNPGRYFALLYILDGMTLFAGSIADNDSNRFSTDTPDLRDDCIDIDQNDVGQGYVPNCYLMTTMLTLAKYRPDLLQANMSQVGDTNVFHVNLWDDGSSTPVQETVVLNLTNGANIADLSGDYETDTGKVEVWTQVLEQAYVQRFHGGNYGNFSGGSSAVAWRRFTGLPGSSPTPGTTSDDIFDQIAQNWDPPNGKYVVIGTVDNPPFTLLLPNHAYLVVGVDTNAGN